MRRSAAALVLGLAALLLTPGAAGEPNVDGDPTPPVITPSITGSVGSNGWYVTNVTVNWVITDPESIILSSSGCDSRTLTSDTTGNTLTCTATSDGGTTTVSKTFKVDRTPPSEAATPARDPDANGWYNDALTVSFAGTDPTSGIASCVAPRTYSGPDSASASVSGTCTDKAGNVASRTFSLSYDATAPTISATPDRQPNANGWYRAAVTIDWSGADALSGIASCDPDSTYSGPDSANASRTGTCTDKAGNVASRTFSLNYDATAPTGLAATPQRQPNANGWYRAAVTIDWSANDATSGIDSCTSTNYNGPETAGTTLSGTCTDRAGNSTPTSVPFSLSYDATAPTVSATPDRQPNANGWYRAAVTIDWSGADVLSGIASCDADSTYSGPDSANASRTGTCTDKAGNVGSGSLTLTYDATAPSASPKPSRSPDENGWYNHQLTIGFSGTDDTSGIDTCTQATYSGPDTGSTAVTGTCLDEAGNSSALSSFALSYDATAPQVTSVVPVRPPDQARWYNHAITFAFQGQDAMSGLDSCSPTTYTGPDGANVSVTGACVDQAGNRGVASFPLSYDGTAPTVTASPGRGPDADGWYNHPLAISFAGSDGASGVDSCAAPKSYDGPDSADAAVSGLCVDKAGNVAFGSLGMKYDATAPQMLGATTVRAPDSNGWFNQPLTVDFHGNDATSQIAACTEAGYAGPDNPAAVVSGSCRDHAGNESGSIDFGLKYDATAPKAASVTVTPGDRMAVVRWQVSADTKSVEVVRFAGRQAHGISVYRGAADSYTDRGLRNGIRYRYAVSGFDDAGNAATSSAVAVPRAPLFLPAAGARVTAPPLLAWAPAPQARYYNVQVWRRGKIFSAWPSRTRLRLTRSWTYRGRQYHLTPGRYRWYVWPGYGPRAAKRYGRLIGASSFVVVSRG